MINFCLIENWLSLILEFHFFYERHLFHDPLSIIPYFFRHTTFRMQNFTGRLKKNWTFFEIGIISLFIIESFKSFHIDLAK